jgi:transcriptional regulator with GAF, ATPase, and Fis domain
MKTSRHRAVLVAIWGLLAAFGLLQIATWTMGTAPARPWGLAQVVAGWLVMVLLAAIATRRIDRLAAELLQTEHAHRATRDQVEQLQMHSAMLDIFARSGDVPLALRALAPRIARLVPCDRVGLALLTEGGDEFQTYTARITEDERRSRARPEVTFKAEGTAIGSAVKSGEPLIISDTAAGASEFIDTNVAHTSGFASAAVIPLVSKGRAVGTLNVVSRRRNAFTRAHVEALRPVAEIFAMAHVAQQLQVAVARHGTVASMTEITKGMSSEINGALQAITGHCDLIGREFPDPDLQRELSAVVGQAQRISTLLDRMQSASHERLNEAAETMKQGAASRR